MFCAWKIHLVFETLGHPNNEREKVRFAINFLLKGILYYNFWVEHKIYTDHLRFKWALSNFVKQHHKKHQQNFFQVEVKHRLTVNAKHVKLCFMLAFFVFFCWTLRERSGTVVEQEPHNMSLSPDTRALVKSNVFLILVNISEEFSYLPSLGRNNL